MKILIASGKGGTGKTLVATHLAAALGNAAYVDADVEAANGHLFLHPDALAERPAEVPVPRATDACTGCGACAKVCRFGALAAVKGHVLVFSELCHSCGACLEVCPVGALKWAAHALGTLRTGTYRLGSAPAMPFADGRLATGQVRASALIAQVKAAVPETPFTVIDGPPGCSCAAAEAVRGTDVCLLVTEPTPFGLSDLRRAADLVEHLGVPHAVLLNRADLAGTDVRGFCASRGIPVLAEMAYDADLAARYARGRLAYDLDRYRRLFDDLAHTITSGNEAFRRPTAGAAPVTLLDDAAVSPPERCTDRPMPEDLVQVVVISGKGGTGKTSLAASLAAARRAQAADCDVDAGNLHLLLVPRDETREPFSGAAIAVVDAPKCRGCGVCANECRFEAITLTPRATIDPLRCEGCGLCTIVCPLAGTDEMPLSLHPRRSGFASIGPTPHGSLARGDLDAGGEASGRLVTVVRRLAERQAVAETAPHLLIDASPGMGCTVNAGLTGTDLAVAVTEPTQSGLHDLLRALDLAAWFKVPAMVVVNKADLCPEMTAEMRAACAARGIDVVAEIPFDRAVPENLARGLIPSQGDGPAATALGRAVQTILGRVDAIAQSQGASRSANATAKEPSP